MGIPRARVRAGHRPRCHGDRARRGSPAATLGRTGDGHGRGGRVPGTAGCADREPPRRPRNDRRPRGVRDLRATAAPADVGRLTLGRQRHRPRRGDGSGTRAAQSAGGSIGRSQRNHRHRPVGPPRQCHRPGRGRPVVPHHDRRLRHPGRRAATHQRLHHAGRGTAGRARHHARRRNGPAATGRGVHRGGSALRARRRGRRRAGRRRARAGDGRLCRESASRRSHHRPRHRPPLRHHPRACSAASPAASSWR